MPSDLSPLKAVLKATPPAALAEKLTDEQVIALAALMRDAHARQQTQLTTALDHALGYVPRILRGTVRGILFP
jgi:hypothetical protein